MSDVVGYDRGPDVPQDEPEPAPRAGPVEIAPGVIAGDFVNGKGLLGVRRMPHPDPTFQFAALRTPPPPKAEDVGAVQTATRAVNGVPLAIYQPQSSETGAVGVGDVDGLVRSLSRFSPRVLERFSNANLPFIAVPDSTDQAYPNANLLQVRPRGYPAHQDFGDAAGGYVDFTRNDEVRKHLSKTDPLRAVVVGSSRLSSSYDVPTHEIGHGFDRLNSANGKAASQRAEFQRAYAAEVPNLRRQAEAKAATDPANKAASFYYLQGRSNGVDVGASEAYAESLARFMAGDPNLKADWPSLYDYWEAQDRANGIRATPAQRGR